jgi:glutathione S-transferase
MSEPEAKRQRKHPEYELLYHAGIPGRGEFVRLAFVAAGVPYTDVANETPSRTHEVYAACAASNTSSDTNPCFSPPILRVAGGAGGNNDGKPLLLGQTANILLYLGPELGLVGTEDVHRFYVNQLTLTALDMNDEVHETHHPIAGMQYYEEQKEPALLRSRYFREFRIPKFFGYFERVLKGNEASGKGVFTVGDKLTYADTTFWQVVDGLMFAFPKEMEARKESGEYPLIFGKFYEGIKNLEGIKEYLASDKRLKYSNGIFRYYPELDRE